VSATANQKNRVSSLHSEISLQRHTLTSSEVAILLFS
jgi:hypothetical protein